MGGLRVLVGIQLVYLFVNGFGTALSVERHYVTDWQGLSRGTSHTLADYLGTSGTPLSAPLFVQALLAVALLLALGHGRARRCGLAGLLVGIFTEVGSLGERLTPRLLTHWDPLGTLTESAILATVLLRERAAGRGVLREPATW